MKVKSYEEQLIEVQVAICDLLAGAEEASYNGQRVRKTSLDMLQRREEYLRNKIETKNRGGIRVRGAVPD